MTFERDVLIGGALAGLFAAVFGLPFLVPTHGDSLSYICGFNNHAALLALLFGSFLFAWWTRNTTRLNLPSATLRGNVPRAVLLPVFAAAILGCAALWVSAARHQPAEDATYFLDRYQHLLVGQKIYVDFSFDYGPLLFYPAVWLHTICRLSFANAYYLGWTFQWLLGLATLGFVVNSVAGSKTSKGIAFGFCSLLWLTSIVDGGANYTPFRFIASSAVAIVGHKFLLSGRRFSWLAWSIAGSAALFLYSAEQGITFVLATVAYVAVFGFLQRYWGYLLSLLAVFTVLLFVGSRHHLLDTILLFGGGDYDLPLLLTATTGAWVLCIVAAVCLLVHAWHTHQAKRPEAYLVLLGLAALPAALGRADPGHLFINTMPAIVVAVVSLCDTNRTARAATVGAWCLVTYAAFVMHFVPLRKVSITGHTEGVVLAAKKEASHLRDALPSRGIKVLAPFGYPMDFQLTSTLPVLSGRFAGYGMVSRKLPALVIGEIESQPGSKLIVPSDYHSNCLSSGSDQLDLMTFFTFGPALLPDRHRTVDVARQLCEYLDGHYEPEQALSVVPNFIVLRRRR